MAEDRQQPDHGQLLKRGQRIAFSATLAALAMAVMKGWIGVAFDSPVLVADAFHSGSDIVINLASGFGLWLAGRKRSGRFPYGLYKAETLACFIISLFILFTSIEIFQEGWEKLGSLSAPESFPVFPVAATLISSLVSWLIARRMKRVGREIGSDSLTANAREALLDVYVSLVVLAGILLAFARIPLVEGAVIILISLLIAKVGLESLWRALMVLLDANLDPDLERQIQEKINGIYGVRGVGEVRIRQSGPFKLVECVVKTKPDISMYQAHELADRAEAKIYEECQGIESVFVHTEPVKEEQVTVMIPVDEMAGMDSRVCTCFACAPFFAVLILSRDGVRIEDFYLNEHQGAEKHRGIGVVKSMIEYKVDCLVTADIGEIAFHFLKDHYVDIFRAEKGQRLENAVLAYQRGELSAVLAPLRIIDQTGMPTVSAQGG